MTAPVVAGDTVLVGLLGRGIGASRTPRMHMAEGQAQGLSYDYRLIDAATQDLPDLGVLLRRLEGEGFRGLNVTYPFKKDIIPFLDELSEAAQVLGAVNTVVFRDGRRHGHNTDHWGFGESFRTGLPDATRGTALLMGAGGAGRAVGSALLDQGVGKLLIHDLDGFSANWLTARLAERYGSDRVGAVENLAQAAAEADGLVNATPMGMEKLPGLPLPEALIAPRHWVADIVYFPLETALLAAARAKGCQVLPGSGMAVYQAVRAFGLFTGRTADPDRMKATFDSLAEVAA
ncbi:MAG: shikimate dehydrogenase [Qingshengfaniella sp.]